MTCEQARTLLHDEHDDVLTPAQQARLDAHLRSCPACQSHRHQLQLLVGALDLLRIETDSEVVRENAARSTTGRTAGRFRVAGMLAASAAAVILLSLGPWHTRQRSPVAIPDTGKPQVSVEPAPAVPAPVVVNLQGRSADTLLVVKVHSSQPNVHVFRLCSVYSPQTERENRQPSSEIGD